MIKLSANVSKKVPVPDVEYSSQNFSAGMEVEVGSDTSKSELKEKFRSLYQLLADSIQEQIREAGIEVPERQGQRTRQPQMAGARAGGNGGNGHGGNGKSHGGNGSGNGRKATQAQVRAIYAIARDRGYDDGELREMLATRFGAHHPTDLSLSDASSAIDNLKNNGKE